MSKDDKRDKERLTKRHTPSYNGPLVFPEDLKDPNYVYAWGVKDPQSPWKLLNMRQKGYEPVELNDSDHPYAKIFASGESGKAGYVIVPGSKGIEHILMRLPKVRAEEIFAEKQEAAAERNKALYEDGTELSGTVSGSNQFVFKTNS
jgi:hypothetical protein